MSHYQKSLLVLFSFASLFGCGEQSGKKAKEESIEFETNYFSLNHDTLLLAYPAVNRMIGKDSFLTFYQDTYSFVIFDFESRKPIWHKDLAKEGPNKLATPAKDALIRNDSLFVLNFNEFSIFNLAGEKLLTLGLKEIDGLRENFRLSEIDFAGTDKIVFSKVVYSSIYPKPYNKPESIFFTYNLNTGELEDLPLFNPDVALLADETKGFYQSVSEHFFSVNDSLLVYNFRWGSNIYTYNLSNGEKSVYPAKSENTANIREYITAKDVDDIPIRIKYSRNGPHFISTYFDPQNKMYYRGHYDFTIGANGEPEKNNYLMVFDENFNVVKEVKIDIRSANKPIINNGKVYLSTALIEWPEGKNEYLELTPLITESSGESQPKN